MSDSENDSSESVIGDSDVELQEAFAAGLIKPGLNKVEVKKKSFVNNIKGLKQKLKDIALNLPWIEKLDCVNKLAPLAPELASSMKEQEAKRESQLKNNKKLLQVAPANDPVLNDFKREMSFHRQAQSAVMEIVPTLTTMGIIPIRPDDYFAEMVKTDTHMQRIRQKLMQTQAQKQRSERVKQLRTQRKEGKALQNQAKVKRQNEKRDILEQVKKVKKGLSKDMSFLDGKTKRKVEKRKMKDKKFGFGGKKRGLKVNNKESAADIEEYRRPGKKGGVTKRGKQNPKGGVPKRGKPNPNKRLGKNRRMKNTKKGKK